MVFMQDSIGCAETVLRLQMCDKPTSTLRCATWLERRRTMQEWMARLLMRVIENYINDLIYRTQNDFGLAIVSTDNLGESSEKKNQGGRVEFFYRALQACFFIDFSCDAGCDGEVGHSNPESASWNFKMSILN